MASEYRIDYKTQIKITDEDILDIMSSAVYGIAYWVQTMKYPDGKSLGDNAEEHVANGGSVIVVIDEPIEDGGPVEFPIDKFTVLKGVEKYLAEGNRPYNILEVDSGEFVLDCGMIDADVSDMIIQYGLFGEIVFG